jgi:myo-inositol 2-dehydrogenase/D-chiro-inositol 1-dehydrogenase
MERVRIGLIGAGVMGRIHARCLSQHVESAHLIAVADMDGAKAAQFAEEFGAEAVYTDPSALLADGSIAAVVVCTPANTHAAIIEAAADAGRHILCEKPLDWDLSAADRALQAVERAGVILQMGFQRRFDPAFMRARDQISLGRAGPIDIVSVVSRDPPLPYTGPKPGGDLYFETTIHDLDMLRFLTGEEAESVVSFGTAWRLAEEGAGEDPDTALTLLRLQSGALAVIDNSRRSNVYDQRAEIFGPRGVVKVENEPGASDASDLPFFGRRYWQAYLAELNAFVECVRTGAGPAVTGADGRAALVLAIAAYDSFREGRPVSVNEIG